MRSCATQRSAMPARPACKDDWAPSSPATMPIWHLSILKIPPTSAAPQLVYTETGRGVESVGAKCQHNFGRRDSMGESTRVLPPRAACLSAAVALSLVAPPSAAEDFFAGKQIEVLVGSAVGGGCDAYARFLARHMGRF